MSRVVSNTPCQTVHANSLPGHAPAAFQGVVEAEKSRGVDHAKVKRQSQRPWPKADRKSQRSECVEGQLGRQESCVELRAEQEKIGNQGREHGEWRHQAYYFVRDEEE